MCINLSSIDTFFDYATNCNEYLNGSDYRYLFVKLKNNLAFNNLISREFLFNPLNMSKLIVTVSSDAKYKVSGIYQSHFRGLLMHT